MESLPVLAYGEGGAIPTKGPEAYTVKKVIDFPVRNREVTIAKLSLAGNNLIIPGQGEFG